MKEADGIVLVYAVDSKESFDALEDYLEYYIIYFIL